MSEKEKRVMGTSLGRPESIKSTDDVASVFYRLISR